MAKSNMLNTKLIFLARAKSALSFKHLSQTKFLKFQIVWILSDSLECNILNLNKTTNTIFYKKIKKKQEFERALGRMRRPCQEFVGKNDRQEVSVAILATKCVFSDQLLNESSVDVRLIYDTAVLKVNFKSMHFTAETLKLGCTNSCQNLKKHLESLDDSISILQK